MYRKISGKRLNKVPHFEVTMFDFADKQSAIMGCTNTLGFIPIFAHNLWSELRLDLIVLWRSTVSCPLSLSLLNPDNQNPFSHDIDPFAYMICLRFVANSVPFNWFLLVKNLHSLSFLFFFNICRFFNFRLVGFPPNWKCDFKMSLGNAPVGSRLPSLSHGIYPSLSPAVSTCLLGARCGLRGFCVANWVIMQQAVQSWLIR